MTTVEDAVRDTLAARAQAAPVRLDGRQMLDRLDRRGLRTWARLGAAAAAVAVLAAGTAVWRTQTVPRLVDADHELAVPVSPEPTSSAPPPTRVPVPPVAWRTTSWGDLRFAVAVNWTVNDTGETWPHPWGALVEGPYFGTLRTGPMCRPLGHGGGGCSRDNGILEREPTWGVVGWIAVAPVMANAPAGDPGPDRAACPGRANVFHAYRVVRASSGSVRVTVDGCAYGAHAHYYLSQLQRVADSIRAD